MDNSLKSTNMLSFIIHSIIGIRILTLPRDIIQYAGNDGWMSVIIMGIGAFCVGYSFYWLGIRNQGHNFSQICGILYGRIIGRIIMLGIGIYTTITIGLLLRIFGEGVKIFLLDNTPLIVVVSVILIVNIYCLKCGVTTISIVLDILLPFIIFFVMLLIILSLTTIDIGHLLPIFYGGIMPIIKGALEVTDPFLTVGIIGYILPYTNYSKDIKKWVVTGIGTGVSIYVLIVLVCILVFGSKEVTFLVFPTMTLSKSVQLETHIFERAESFFMAAWIPITFTTILMYYLVSTLNLKTLFNSKNDNIIIYLQIPIFIALALIPENIAKVFEYQEISAGLAKILFFGLMPISVIMEFFKKRRSNQR